MAAAKYPRKVALDGWALSKLLFSGLGFQSPRWPEAVAFDIAAGPLGSALQQFSQQAQLQVLFPPEPVANAVVSAVAGRYTPAEALAALLAGTGFTYALVNERTVAIGMGAVPAPATSSDHDEVRSGLDEVLAALAQSVRAEIRVANASSGELAGLKDAPPSSIERIEVLAHRASGNSARTASSGAFNLVLEKDYGSSGSTLPGCLAAYRVFLTHSRHLSQPTRHELGMLLSPIGTGITWVSHLKSLFEFLRAICDRARIVRLALARLRRGPTKQISSSRPASQRFFFRPFPSIPPPHPMSSRPVTAGHP